MRERKEMKRENGVLGRVGWRERGSPHRPREMVRMSAPRVMGESQEDRDRFPLDRGLRMRVIGQDLMFDCAFFL